MTDKLTGKKYWDSTYAKRSSIPTISLNGYKNYCVNKIYEKKSALIARAENVLEIGGGGSAWLIYLAERFPEKRFSVLDYSHEGCEKLRDSVGGRRLCNVDVYEEDFFSPSHKIGEFDLVYSHGVVEHFNNLSEVLLAHSMFLSKDGRMFTVIPNMAGVLGVLTKWLNRDVYNIHVPHDLASFEEGHREAGLKVIDSGYLCSHNFGVLSSCASHRLSFNWWVSRLLGRLSQAAWLFESAVSPFPVTKTFSPYIYVVSEK